MSTAGGAKIGIGLKLITPVDKIISMFMKEASEVLNRAINAAIPSIISRLSDLVNDVVYGALVGLPGPIGDALSHNLAAGVQVIEFNPVRPKGSQVDGALVIGLVRENTQEDPWVSEESFKSIIANYRISLFGEGDDEEDDGRGRGGTGGRKNSKSSKSSKNSAYSKAYNFALDQIVGSEGGSGDDSLIALAFQTEEVQRQVEIIISEEVLNQIR